MSSFYTYHTLSTRYLSTSDIFTIATGGTLKPRTAPTLSFSPLIQQPRQQAPTVRQIPAQPIFLFDRPFLT